MKKEVDGGVIIFTCSLCEGIKNNDRHLVLDHIETNHVISTYECGECGIILPTKSLINIHHIKKHGSELMGIINYAPSRYRNIIDVQGMKSYQV